MKLDLRGFAEGQACVMCKAQDGTVCLAHYFGPRRHAYGGGMGHKGDDAVGAHLCMACHKFDYGVDEKVFRAARMLVEKYHLRPYRHMAEADFQYLESQTQGATSIVRQVLHVAKEIGLSI